MRLTHEEWDRHAAIAAAHRHGENHVAWYRFQRYAGLYGIIILIGLLGFGAYWIWHHISLPSAGTGGLPTAFWVVVVGLALGTFYVFRPGQGFRTAAVTIVRGMVVGLLWLGLAVYALTVAL